MVANFFTPFPTLITKRLTLRQLSTDDAENIFALRSNPEINKYLDRQPSKTIEDAINFIIKINDNIKKDESIYWAINLKNSNTLVGTICLFAFSNENKTCEIGYELLTNFRGQGLMIEAVERVIDYAFQTLKFQQIEAITHNENYNSTKLLINAGFKKSKEVDEEHPMCSIFTLTKILK